MAESISSLLASVIRPLLREVGRGFALEDGILGIALRPSGNAAGAPTDVFFAEFVGPSYLSPVTDTELVASHYELPRSNILSIKLMWDAIQQPAGLLPPVQIDMAMIVDGGLKEITEPLCRLFGGHPTPPKTIRIYGAWLAPQLSMLYYIPARQEISDAWSQLVDSGFLVAHLLRAYMTFVSAGGESEGQAIHALLACLPDSLHGYDERLRALSLRVRRFEKVYEQDLRRTKIEIDYAPSKNEILLTALRPGSPRIQVARIQCTRDLRLSGKSGANLIVAESEGKKTKKQREMKQTLALFILNKSLSANGDAPQRVNYAQAYRFFRNGAAGMPPADTPPAVPKLWQDYVGTRVRRANEHLRELLGATDDDEFFSNTESNYTLLLDVVLSEAYSDRLKAGLSRSSQRRSPGFHESSNFFADLALECAFAEALWDPEPDSGPARQVGVGNESRR